MFSRRKALKALGAGVCATITAGTAGCLDEGPSQEAQQSYDDARASLVENAEILEELAAGTADRNPQTIESIRSNVDDARASLDAVPMGEAGPLSSRIDRARAVADFQAELATYHELAIDVRNSQEDAAAFADAEQNERAVEEYEAAKTRLQNLRRHLDDLEATHRGIDQDGVDDSDLAYSDPYTAYVDIAGRGELDAHERRIDGDREINTVFVELETGFDAFDREEHGSARESFDDAKTAATEAREAYEAVQDHEDAPRDLRNESIAIAGVAAELEEAIDLFIEATHEAEAGNGQEAVSLAQEGWSVIEAAFE